MDIGRYFFHKLVMGRVASSRRSDDRIVSTSGERVAHFPRASRKARRLKPHVRPRLWTTPCATNFSCNSPFGSYRILRGHASIKRWHTCCARSHTMVGPILVTGGAGFVGSALIRRLIRETDECVVNVDCLTHPSATSGLDTVVSSPRYSFEQVDVRDAEAVRSVLQRYRPRSILHLARSSPSDRSPNASLHYVHTNVVGTCTLLAETARFLDRSGSETRSGFKFVHVSTDEAFGSLGARGALTETAPHRPDTPYAASCAAAEHFVKSWSQTFGLPGITAICSRAYGPFQRPDAFVPNVILRALERRPIVVYGDGRDAIDRMFIDDKVSALLEVLDRGRIGESYCIGGRAERQTVQVVTSICDLLDELHPRGDGRSFRSQIRFGPDRRARSRRYATDSSKLEREFGWAARETWESGVRQTVQWYVENQAWCARIRETAEHALPLRHRASA